MKKFLLGFLLLGFSLQDIIIKADLSLNRKEQKALAKQALEMAQKCIEKNPKEAACYYYRAQARGIYHGRFFIGYTSRVRSMLKDWEKAMALDPLFDYGGPYRMIAEVYIDLPKAFGPKDLRQDLDKAIALLQKAIQISDYPTNHLDLAEAYIKKGDKEAARKALAKVEKLLPKWANHPYFADWQSRFQNMPK